MRARKQPDAVLCAAACPLHYIHCKLSRSDYSGRPHFNDLFATRCMAPCDGLQCMSLVYITLQVIWELWKPCSVQALEPLAIMMLPRR